ncbi:hypothetical protein GCM10029992_18320 [Glycomyces albus]
MAALLEEYRSRQAEIGAIDAWRDRLEELGRPVEELPLLTDGVDLSGLYELARTLRASLGKGAGMPSDLDVDALLADEDKHVIACCGSGGVGKTTTAAAFALRAAERHGRRTVVLTIDPARRLAQSLGMEALDNTPRPVEGSPAGRWTR